MNEVKQKTQLNKAQGGFTLIELLIVVAIIGILAAIAIPQYQDYIDTAAENACAAELTSVRNLAAAEFATTTSYADLPAAVTAVLNGTVGDFTASACDGGIALASGTLTGTVSRGTNPTLDID